MTNQKMDLQSCNLQVLSDSELNELNGGGFWHGLLLVITGAAELIYGIPYILIDIGAIAKEGSADIIAGFNEIQGQQ
jgi:hypothetical protein